MKKAWKQAAALLCLAVMVLSLAACGGAADSGSGGAPGGASDSGASSETTEAADSDLDYILNKGTLVVGFDDAFPPFSYQADDGSYTGFDLACAADLAARWGLEIVYQPVAWASKEQELNSKSIDIIWSGLGINPERLQVVSFSGVYCQDGGAIVTKPDSGITSLADLAGKTVACQAGNGYIIRLDEAVVDTFGELLYQDTTAELLMQLDVGGCDAVICDSVSASYTAQQSGYDFVYIDIVADMGGEMSNYAVGCRLGSADLAARIDETLHEMYQDGTLTRLSEEYLGGDYAADCVVTDLLAEARASGQQG